MTGPPRFELPPLPAATDGWGPSGPPASLEGGVPYAPFSKGERIGRIADFTPSAFKHGKRAREWRERERQGREETGWFNRWNEVADDGGLSIGGEQASRSLTLALSLPFFLSNSNSRTGRYDRRDREPSVSVFNLAANEEVRLFFSLGESTLPSSSITALHRPLFALLPSVVFSFPRTLATTDVDATDERRKSVAKKRGSG
jgi:hypothetical protein